MNNEHGGGQAYEMGAARRIDYLSIKTKFWSIQELLDEKRFSWIRKKFQQRKCSNDKIERKIWSFVSQFALAFLQTKGVGFFSQGLCGGGGGGGPPQAHPWIP